MQPRCAEPTASVSCSALHHSPSPLPSLCHPWPLTHLPGCDNSYPCQQDAGAGSTTPRGFFSSHTHTHTAPATQHQLNYKTCTPGPIMAGSVNVCPPNECLAAVGAGELVSMQDVHGRMNRRVEKGGGGGGGKEEEEEGGEVDVWDEPPFVPRQGHCSSTHNVDTPETARIRTFLPPPRPHRPPLRLALPLTVLHQPRRRRLFRTSPTETPSSMRTFIEF